MVISLKLFVQTALNSARTSLCEEGQGMLWCYPLCFVRGMHIFHSFRQSSLTKINLSFVKKI